MGVLDVSENRQILAVTGNKIAVCTAFKLGQHNHRAILATMSSGKNFLLGDHL
jgi:hypothetical protein